MFSKLVNDDSAVKAIFDHFRNLGIIALVFSAAFWTFNNPASGWLRWMTTWSTFSLSLLGLFLFALNERHGSRKMYEAGIPAGWHLIALLVYGPSLVMIVFALVAQRS